MAVTIKNIFIFSFTCSGVLICVAFSGTLLRTGTGGWGVESICLGVVWVVVFVITLFFLIESWGSGGWTAR